MSVEAGKADSTVAADQVLTYGTWNGANLLQLQSNLRKSLERTLNLSELDVQNIKK